MYPKGNMIQRLLSFSGCMGNGEFWSEMGVRLVSWFCTVIALSIAVCVVLPLETQTLIAVAEGLAILMAVLWGIPMVALTRRRLRDGGHTAKAYLWLLLPVAGWIVLIVLLCGPSISPAGENC